MTDSASSSAITVSGSALFADWISESDLALEANKHPRTLKRWRDLGEGPPFVRIGRKVFYRREAVRIWLLRREQGIAQ